MCYNCWPIFLNYSWLIVCYLETLLWKIYMKCFPNPPFLQFMLLHIDFSLVRWFDIKRRNKVDVFFLYFPYKSCCISQFLLPLSEPQNYVLSVRSNCDLQFWQSRSSTEWKKIPLLVTQSGRPKTFTIFRNTCFLALSDDRNTVIYFNM